jgi:hypothetical protein
LSPTWELLGVADVLKYEDFDVSYLSLFSLKFNYVKKHLATAQAAISHKTLPRQREN